MKFLSLEFALYLYKSTILGIVGIVTFLEPFAHRRNIASLSPFYRYYFGRYLSELAQVVPLPYSRGQSSHYSDRFHDFSVTIPRCYKDFYVNSFFLAQLDSGILCL